MRKYVCLVSLCAALMAPTVAFADAQTVDFDALMVTGANCICLTGHPYDFLDPDGFYKDQYHPTGPPVTNHVWVPPCDNNGNGIPDVIEFAVLSAIFADTGNPHHTEIHEAWKANVTRAAADLGATAAMLASPWLEQIMAAYVTLGDGAYQSQVIGGTRYGWGFTGSWGIYAETIGGMASYGSAWNTGAPAEANYQKKPLLVGPCGNADGDSVINIGEYYGQGGVAADSLAEGELAGMAAVRAAYVAAVLATGTAVNGGDPDGVCAGGPGPGALAWGVNLWYNPTTRSVYTVGPNMPWTPGRYWAQNSFTVGDPPVAVVGDLAIDNSADLNAWFVANILSVVGSTMWIGATDQTNGTCTTTEGHWKWIATCTEFWSGKGSGLVPPGAPVGGAFSAWNGGPAGQTATTEPNNSSTENFGEIGTGGGWNDSNATTTRPLLVEFSNGGAGYDDTDHDGYPDWWLTYVPKPGGPTAAFSADVTSGMQPLTVHFNSTASDPGEGDTIASWAWDFGDGGTSTLQNPTYIFENFVGSPFTVTLTVTTAADLTDSDVETGYITVEERIYGARIEAGSPTLQVGDVLSLTVIVRGATGVPTYEWKEGDVTLATTATYERVLTDPDIGMHTYRCLVNDVGGEGPTTAGPYTFDVFAEGSMPVAGIVGLALLAGAAILGARFSMRKK